MSEKLEELEYLSQQLHAHNVNMTRAARSNSIHIVQNQKPNETEEVMKLAEEVRQLRSMSCMVPVDEFDDHSFLQEYLANTQNKELTPRESQGPENGAQEKTNHFAKDKLSLETDQQTITPPENQEPAQGLGNGKNRTPDRPKEVPASKAKKTLKRDGPAGDGKLGGPLAALPPRNPSVESPKGGKLAAAAPGPAEKTGLNKSAIQSAAKTSPEIAPQLKPSSNHKSSKPAAPNLKAENCKAKLPAVSESDKAIPRKLE